MPRLIDADALDVSAQTQIVFMGRNAGRTKALVESVVRELIKNAPTADAVEVVRCGQCIHAVPLDKHCELSPTFYRHCTLLRGEETKNVWHKYKKYYRDYSLVERDGFCDQGERKEGDGV